MSSNNHPFDQALSLTPEQDYYIATPSAQYQNMVGPFGGVTAALIVKSVLQHKQCQGTPVALTVNYTGPVNDTDIKVHPVLVRTNRSNQHWRIELSQGEEVQCTATLMCANRRATWENQEILAPDAPAFNQVNSPNIDFAPKWINNYDIRIISGSPFPGAPSNEDIPTETLVWMRDKPNRPLDFPSLTALCDAFFPRLFVLKKQMSPIGTVSLTIHFHTHADELESLSSSLVLGHARASSFRAGYFDQTAEVYSENGRLLATTSQMVYFKG